MEQPTNTAGCERRLKSTTLASVELGQLKRILHHIGQYEAAGMELKEAYALWLEAPDLPEITPVLIRDQDEAIFLNLIAQQQIQPKIDVSLGPPLIFDTSELSARTPRTPTSFGPNDQVNVVPTFPPLVGAQMLRGGSGLHKIVRESFIASAPGQYPNPSNAVQFDYVVSQHQQIEKDTEDARRKNDTFSGPLKILTVLETKFTKDELEAKKTFEIPRTTIGRRLIVNWDNYNTLEEDVFMTMEVVPFLIRKVAGRMTRKGKSVLVLDNFSQDGTELMATCKDWSPLLMRTVDVVFCPAFQRDSPWFWVLIIAEPKRRVIRLYDGLREFAGAEYGDIQQLGDAAATIVQKAFDEHAQLNMKIWRESDIMDMNKDSCGPALVAMAALFAEGMKLEDSPLSEDKLRELRWWMAYQTCYPGDIDEPPLQRLVQSLGTEIDEAEAPELLLDGQDVTRDGRKGPKKDSGKRGRLPRPGGAMSSLGDLVGRRFQDERGMDGGRAAASGYGQEGNWDDTWSNFDDARKPEDRGSTVERYGRFKKEARLASSAGVLGGVGIEEALDIINCRLPEDWEAFSVEETAPLFEELHLSGYLAFDREDMTVVGFAGE